MSSGRTNAASAGGAVGGLRVIAQGETELSVGITLNFDEPPLYAIFLSLQPSDIGLPTVTETSVVLQNTSNGLVSFRANGLSIMAFGRTEHYWKYVVIG